MTRPQQIRAQREALRLSQRELALLMGYTHKNTVQRHESGENRITDTTWKLYCVVLGIKEGEDGRE